jgi:hypothetical protein
VIIERVVRAAGAASRCTSSRGPPHTLKAEKLIEGRGRIADHGGRRRQGAQAQGPAPARQGCCSADGARAIVGSVNLAPGSFDARRELAIEVDDAHVVGPLGEGREARLESLEALDLTDEGTHGRPREARQGRGGRRTSCSTPIRRRIKHPKHKKH